MFIPHLHQLRKNDVQYNYAVDLIYDGIVSNCIKFQWIQGFHIRIKAISEERKLAKTNHLNKSTQFY